LGGSHTEKKKKEKVKKLHEKKVRKNSGKIVDKRNKNNGEDVIGGNQV